MSQFESMQDINKRLNTLITQLNSSKLSSEELEELEVLSRNLYERAVILNYKAKEEKVYQKNEDAKEAKPVVEVEEIIEPVVKEEKTETLPTSAGEIQFDFSGGFDIPSTPKQEEVVKEEIVSEVEEITEEIEEEIVDEVIEKTTESVSNNGNHNQFYQRFASAYAEASKDRLNTLKLDSLKGAIGLNDRMLFINELFGGDGELFNQTIEFLDNLESSDKAIKKLSELASQHNWNEEMASIDEFAHLINRRYVD